MKLSWAIFLFLYVASWAPAANAYCIKAGTAGIAMATDVTAALRWRGGCELKSPLVTVIAFRLHAIA